VRALAIGAWLETWVAVAQNLGSSAEAPRSQAAQLVRRRPTTGEFHQCVIMETNNMRFIAFPAALLMAVSAGCSSSSPSVATFPESSLHWGPAPSIFPAGAQMAVLEGDPGGTGLFTVRLRLPDGYKIQPHTHPTDENVTVVTGTFLVGMGSTFDANAATTLLAGAFVTAPANQAHFAAARGETIVQVHALGPFAMTYVNPADTPK
jgi:quercetin dioxygenase-like cupin family protein